MDTMERLEPISKADLPPQDLRPRPGIGRGSTKPPEAYYEALMRWDESAKAYAERRFDLAAKGFFETDDQLAAIKSEVYAPALRKLREAALANAGQCALEAGQQAQALQRIQAALQRSPELAQGLTSTLQRLSP